MIHKHFIPGTNGSTRERRLAMDVPPLNPDNFYFVHQQNENLRKQSFMLQNYVMTAPNPHLLDVSKVTQGAAQTRWQNLTMGGYFPIAPVQPGAGITRYPPSPGLLYKQQQQFMNTPQYASAQQMYPGMMWSPPVQNLPLESWQIRRELLYTPYAVQTDQPQHLLGLGVPPTGPGGTPPGLGVPPTAIPQKQKIEMTINMTPFDWSHPAWQIVPPGLPTSYGTGLRPGDAMHQGVEHGPEIMTKRLDDVFRRLESGTPADQARAKQLRALENQMTGLAPRMRAAATDADAEAVFNEFNALTRQMIAIEPSIEKIYAGGITLPGTTASMRWNSANGWTFYTGTSGISAKEMFDSKKKAAGAKIKSDYDAKTSDVTTKLDASAKRKEEFTKLSDEMRQLQADLVKLQNEEKGRQEKLKSGNPELGKLQKEMEDAAQGVKTAQGELAKTREDAANLQKTLKENAAEIKAKADAAITQSEEILKKGGDAGGILKTIVELRAQAIQAQAKVDAAVKTAESQIEIALKQATLAETLVKKLETQLDQAEKKVTALDESLQSTRKQIQLLQDREKKIQSALKSAGSI